MVCRKMHFYQPGNASTQSCVLISGKEQRVTSCCVCVKMEPLEQMVDMTAKLFECDRDEMYSYILRLCSKFFLFPHTFCDLPYLNVRVCVRGSGLDQSEVPE